MIQAEGTVRVTNCGVKTGREVNSEEPALCGWVFRTKPGRGGGGGMRWL